MQTQVHIRPDLPSEHAEASTSQRHNNRPAKKHPKSDQILAALNSSRHILAGYRASNRLQNIQMFIRGLSQLTADSTIGHAVHRKHNFGYFTGWLCCFVFAGCVYKFSLAQGADFIRRWARLAGKPAA